EQVAILSFVQMAAGAGCVAAVTSTDDTIHFTSRDTKPFPLADIPPLLDILERQQAIHLSPEREAEALRPLYALWGESRLGPAFLHPLFQGEKVIGVLVMGNPVSGRPLEPSGLRLARGIAAYLAGVVLFQQHYHMLEMQTEEIAVHLQTFSIEQDKYASIIEAIGDGVVVSNRKGKIYLMNNAAERLLGKSRQELVGQNFSTLYPLIAGGGLTEKSLLNLNRSNEPLSTFFERDDLAVQGQVIPLRNSRQEWMGVLLLLRDVTDRRTADRAKTDFIETISRELRTPLTTAGGYVDLMLGGATGKLNINQQYFLQVVKKGLERANELIANATHLMDMPTGDLRLEMETVPAGDLLKEASRTARPLIVRRKLHFAAELEPELPPIRADRVQLRQALERLLDNACRVTPEGGRVSLRAWTQAEGLNGQQSRYLIVSVSDEGGGLSPKEQKLIFEPVARSTGSVSQRVKERGRDLSPVRAIIEAHGGRIWVESAEGKGSVFHVALPAAEA
ncbi:MAG: PAS domain-containing protein, partial [Caldilineae bacterium]